MIDPQCEWISVSTGRRCVNLTEKVVHGLGVCHWHVFVASQQLERLSTDPAQRVRDHVERLVGVPVVESGGRKTGKTAAMIAQLRDRLREEATEDFIPSMVEHMTVGIGLLHRMCAIIDAQQEQIEHLEQQITLLDRATAHTRVIG